MLKVKKINLLLILIIMTSIKSKENKKKTIINFIYKKAIIATVLIGLLYSLYYKKNSIIAQSECKNNTIQDQKLQQINDKLDNLSVNALKLSDKKEENTHIELNIITESNNNAPTETKTEKIEEIHIDKIINPIKEAYNKIQEKIYNKIKILYLPNQQELIDSFYDYFERSKEEKAKYLHDDYQSFPLPTEAILNSLKEGYNEIHNKEYKIIKLICETRDYIKTNYLPKENELFNSLYDNCKGSKQGEPEYPHDHYRSFPVPTDAVLNSLKEGYNEIHNKEYKIIKLICETRDYIKTNYLPKENELLNSLYDNCKGSKQGEPDYPHDHYRSFPVPTDAVLNSLKEGYNEIKNFYLTNK